MGVTVKCQQCGKEEVVKPGRAKTYKFCSYECRGIWRKTNWTGENHPNWQGGERSKVCEGCGERFHIRKNQPITSFKIQKFCSKGCSDKFGKRLSGEDHPHFKPDARKRSRAGKHGSWARAVISRDNATCQMCEAVGVELHAHHIKPYAEFPELRWDVSNGITLCHKCHWAVHTASNENPVNSVDPLTGGAEGNTEPSFGRKPVEGVTTRGRAYRRFEGHCEWCGTFISKRWSDTVGKAHLFCSRSCAGKFRVASGVAFRKPMAVTSSKSAGRESEDIV